ncbi:high affinity immunoglobulin gamma Fc receptor I-like, partial [Acipenser ruthenus]|uniref:high affinity immunoglobulin gamma Fc receptor I-like n=1 Tax=Acipenser ruthenus TaxID=7906 RepID=UPI002740B8FA
MRRGGKAEDDEEDHATRSTLLLSHGTAPSDEDVANPLRDDAREPCQSGKAVDHFTELRDTRLSSVCREKDVQNSQNDRIRDRHSGRKLYVYRFYTELIFLKVSPDRMQACEVAALILLTVVSCSRQYEELPQTTLTLEPPFPEIFTGETVTLRCGVEGGSAGWKYLWYKDSEDTPVLQTAGRSITGDSYTITAAAVSDQGQYCCRGQRVDQPLYSQLSDKVTLPVSEGHPQAVLTLQPAWAQIFIGETVTLSCEVEGGSAGWRFKQYRDGREEAGCSDKYSKRYGDRCKISSAQESHSGVYWCESASGQERSNAVTLTVSNQWVILQTPRQPVTEGDSLTLR